MPMFPLAWVIAELPRVELPVNSGTVFVVPPDVVTLVWATALIEQNMRPIMAVLDRSIETLRHLLFPFIDRRSLLPRLNRPRLYVSAHCKVTTTSVTYVFFLDFPDLCRLPPAVFSHGQHSSSRDHIWTTKKMCPYKVETEVSYVRPPANAMNVEVANRRSNSAIASSN